MTCFFLIMLNSNKPMNISVSATWREAFTLLTKPRIRRFVIVPVLVNAIIFGIGLYYLLGLTDAWILTVTDYTRDSLLLGWVNSIGAMLWWVLFVVLALVLSFLLTITSNWILAPFLGLLAEAVLKYEGIHVPNLKLRALVAHALSREWRKLRYFLPKILGVLLLYLLPIINLFAPVIWALFSCWMLSIQYIDYYTDTLGERFDNTLQLTKKSRRTTFMHGGVITLLTIIPLLNWLIVPAAVVASTLVAARLNHSDRP